MKNICVKNANGKLKMTSFAQCARNVKIVNFSQAYGKYKNVAKKLIAGHMIPTVAFMMTDSKITG